MSEATEIKDYLELVAYELRNIFDVDEPDELIRKSRLDEAINKDHVSIMKYSHYEWAEWVYNHYGVHHES